MKTKGFHSIQIMFKYAKVPALLSLLLMIVSSGFTSFQMFITKNLIDHVQQFILGDVAVFSIVLWISFMFLSVMFNSSNEYFHTLIDISINKNLTEKFIPMVMGKLKRIDYSCFENTETHNLIERMSRQPQSSVVNCFGSLTQLLTNFFSLLGLVFYFLTVSIPFTLVYIVIAAIYCYLTALRTKKMYQLMDKRAEEKRKMDYLNNLLIQKHPLSELRVLGGAEYIIQKWRNYLRKFLKDFVKLYINSCALQFINNIILCVWAAIMIFYSANLVMDGAQTIGFFIAVLTGIGNIAGITGGLSQSYNSYVSASLSYRYFGDFMALPEVQGVHGGKEPDSIEIRFENVFFTYPNTEKPILNGVSFAVKQNERVSIVGENGAGKSTIIKLLCGLYRPNSGKIYIGGRELDEISPEAARKMFSIVFQDFGQYSITLRENIALGNIENMYDDQGIIDALKLAMGEDLINKSDLGLEMPLGKLEEDGIDLSGGQWQRVSIARAFFSNSKFVVLDEPTAALDPLAECRMYETFLNVLKNKGSITISHRLASAKMADRILVISDGIITEQGTHDELMEKGGIYSKMFISQASWYDESLMQGSVVNA